MSNMAFQEAWTIKEGADKGHFLYFLSLGRCKSMQLAKEEGKGEVVNGRLTKASVGHFPGLLHRKVEVGRSDIKICDDGVEEIPIRATLEGGYFIYF